ncbi:MAG: DUF2357 domain-containing protein [Polyangiales bacterium]
MDRVVLRGLDGSVPSTSGAAWLLDAEVTWVVEGRDELVDGVLATLGRRSVTRISRGVATLRFGNAVGRYDGGPLGPIIVRTSKWTEKDFDGMLDELSRQAVALPFHAGADAALGFEHGDASPIPYHALMWLRHSVLDGDAVLLGALRAIIADPHRRMVGTERLVSATRAGRLSPRALDDIASGYCALERVARGRGIGGSDLFPVEVSETVATSSIDTAENRFALAFLRSCFALVDAVRRRAVLDLDPTSALGRRVLSVSAEIEAELTPILRHRVWESVGRMHIFPASSTVLHRRAPYREVLRQHVLLSMAAKALPLDASEVTQLLEAKDIARLYELWAALAVIDAVRAVKGDPITATAIEQDVFGARVRQGLRVRWGDGTEVGYNVTYSPGAGAYGRSWSLTLRPDIVLYIPSGHARGLHIFDAKFKLEESAEHVGASATAGDLHKMHAYRDAIIGTRSAWVVYPGTEFRAWTPDSSKVESVAELTGVGDCVGTIPLRPKAVGALEGVVRFLIFATTSPDRALGIRQ